MANRSYLIGPPVTGDLIIGKEKDINDILNFIESNVNTTVNGMTRIGKSSVVKECIRRKSDDENLCFFTYEMTDSQTWQSFFKDLSNWFKKIIKEKCENNSELMSKALKLYDGDSVTTVEHREYIELSNEIRKSKDLRFWLIVDEMDRAPRVMKNYIQELREICYSDWIRIITISRLSIDAIFPSDSGGSTFPGIFTGHKCIKGYSDEDLKLFYKDFAGRLNRELLDDEKKMIQKFCGHKPIFLRIVANSFFEAENSLNEEDVEFVLDSWYEKWFRSLTRMGYVSNAFNMSKMKKAQRQNLFVYDILTSNSSNAEFSEMGFKDYLISKNSDELLEQDISNFKSWISQLQDMGNSLNKEMTEAMGRDSDRYKKLQRYKNEIDAMVCKMECSMKLQELKTGFRCNIDESERNEILEKIMEIRGELEE